MISTKVSASSTSGGEILATAPDIVLARDRVLLNAPIDVVTSERALADAAPTGERASALKRFGSQEARGSSNPAIKAECHEARDATFEKLAGPTRTQS